MPRKKEIQFDHIHIAILRTLLANLIGAVSRLHEMGQHRIESEDVPAEQLPFERTVLQLLYVYHDLPTRETLLNHLLLERVDDAEARLDDLLAMRTEDGSVASMAAPLHRWVQKQRLKGAIRDAYRLVDGPDVFTDETYRDAFELFMAARPEMGDAAVKMNHVEQTNWWIEQFTKQRKGYRVRLLYPFKSLNLLLAPPRPSDIILVTAQSKNGKTTLASVFAEDIAWGQGLDVLYLHFETDHTSFVERRNARHLHIPIWAQRASWFSPLDEKPRFFANGYPDERVSAKQLFEAFNRQLEANLRDKGEVTYIHCPLWGPDEVLYAVELQRRAAALRGRCLVVIADYLNAIPKPRAKDEYEAISILTEDLKRIPERFASSEWPIYFILLDQERQEGQEGDHWKTPDDPERIAKNLKRLRSRGSGKGVIRSQVHLTLQRPLADDDAPVYENGLQLQDAMGQFRYYHRKGELSGYCWLFVAHANEDAMGSWIDLGIENNLYIIEEGEVQSCPKLIDLIQERKRLEARMGLD